MNRYKGRKQKEEGRKSPSKFEGVAREARRGSLYIKLKTLNL